MRPPPTSSVPDRKPAPIGMRPGRPWLLIALSTASLFVVLAALVVYGAQEATVLAGVLALTLVTLLAVSTASLAQRAAANMTLELRRNEDRLLRQNEFLDALRATRLGMLQEASNAGSLRLIVQRAATLGGTRHGYLFETDAKGDAMVMRAGAGFFEERVGDRIARGQSVAGIVWETGQTLVVNDYPAWSGRATDSAFDRLQALAGVPLKRGDQTIGVIGLGRLRGEGAGFDDDDITRLTQIGELASLALANAELFREVQEANTRLEQRVVERTQALAESEARYRGIIENIEDGVYELDAAGRITLANAATQRIADLDPGRVTGMHYRQFVMAEDHDAVFRAYNRVFTSGEPAGSIAFRVRTRAGELRDIESTVTLKRDSNGKSIGFRGTLRDVSARTRAEKAQRQLSAYLTALSDTAVGLLGHTRLQDLLGDIIRRAGDLLGSPHGYLYLLDSVEQTMEMRVGTGIQTEFIGNRIRPGEGVAGQIWATGQPLIINDYAHWSGRLTSAGLSALRAVAGVPLNSGRRVIGVLGLAHTEPERQFGSDEVDALTRFASLAAVAIDNAQLLEQTQSALQLSEYRAQRLAAINRIGEQVSRMTERDEIARTVFEQLSHVMDNRNFYIAFYDEERDLISFPVYTIDGEHIQRSPRRPGQGATEHILRTRQPLLLQNNVFDEMRMIGLNPGGRPSQSWLAVPMLVGGKAVGVLCTQDYQRPGAFTTEDQDMLAIIAAQAATALENARLLSESDARLRELEVINELSRALTGLLDTASIAELVGERLRRMFDANVCYVALYDDRAQVISYPYLVEDGERLDLPALPFGSMHTSSVITTQEPMLVRRAADSQPEGTAPDAFARPTGISQLAVPILVGSKPIGMLALENYRYADAFAEGDIRLLTTIGANVGVAIQNARLYEEQQTRARHEQILREATTRIRRGADVDTVLRTAAQEFGNVLGRRASVVLPGRPVPGSAEGPK